LIALPKAVAALTDLFGTERLSMAVLGLPSGATLSDGSHSASGGLPVDLSGWDLARLTLRAADGFTGQISLTVRATSAETSNGASASVSQGFVVHVLPGSAVATPAVLNPFVLAATATQTLQSQAGSQAVQSAPAAAFTLLASGQGQLGTPTPAAAPPKTAAEIAQAEEERARALSDTWLKELEERAKAQWQQLVGGK